MKSKYNGSASQDTQKAGHSLFGTRVMKSKYTKTPCQGHRRQGAGTSISACLASCHATSGGDFRGICSVKFSQVEPTVGHQPGSVSLVDGAG